MPLNLLLPCSHKPLPQETWRQGERSNLEHIATGYFATRRPPIGLKMLVIYSIRHKGSFILAFSNVCL